LIKTCISIKVILYIKIDINFRFDRANNERFS